MPRRSRDNRATVFTIRGLIEGRDEEIEVSWLPIGLERCRARTTNRRGLVGDAELIRRAIDDELDGRTFRGTQTGPFVLADLDDAHAAVLQLGSYFTPGSYEISGEWTTRVYRVGEDAVA
jgi:hypothetical protein